jgi:hypothetical protein
MAATGMHMWSHDELYSKRFTVNTNNGTLNGKVYYFSNQGVDLDIVPGNNRKEEIISFTMRVNSFTSPNRISLIDSLSSILEIFKINPNITGLDIEDFGDGRLIHVNRDDDIQQILNQFLNPQTHQIEYYLRCLPDVLNDRDISAKGG